MASTHTADRIRQTVSSLLFVAILFGSVFGGRLLTESIRTRVADLRDGALSSLESATAQTLSWDAVSPSVVRGITVYGVRISDAATARRLTIRIDLTAILTGNTAGLVPEITIERPTIALEREAQWQRLERTIGWIQSVAVERQDISIRIRQGSLALFRDGRRLDASSVIGDVDLTGGRFTGRFSTQVAVRTTVDNQPFTIRARASADIEGSNDGPDFGATVDVREISGSHLTLTDQSFRVERGAESIRLERIRSDDPVDLAAELNPTEGRVSLSVVAQRYRPATTVQLRGPWSEHQEWLETTTLTGDFDTDYALESRRFRSFGSVAVTSRHSLLPDPVALRADYDLDPEGVQVSSLRVAGREGSASFRGSYRFGNPGPNGTAQFDQFLWGPTPVLDGRVDVSGTAGGAGLSSEQFSVGGIPVYRLTGGYRPDGRYRSAWATFGLTPEDRGTVEVETRFADAQDITGEVVVEGVRIEQIASLLATLGTPVEIPGPLAGTELRAVVRADYRDQSLTARLPYAILADAADGRRVASLTGDYRDGTFVVERAFARIGETRVTADGFVRRGSAGTIDFQTDVAVNGVAYPLRGTVTPRGEMTIIGPDGVEVRVERSAGGIRVSARLSDVPIPVGSARVSAEITGQVFSTTDWYVNGDRIEIVGLPALSGGTGDLTMALSVRPGEGSVAVTSYEDATSRLAGTLDFSYAADFAAGLQATGRLAAFDSMEQYRLAARYADGQVAVDLRFTDAPARRVLPDIRDGTVGGALQIAGSLDTPQMRLFLESEALELPSRTVSLRTLAYVDADVLRLSGTEVESGTLAASIAELQVRRESGVVSGQMELRRLDAGRSYQIALTGSTAPVTTLDPGDLATRPVTARVSVASQSVGDDGAGPFLDGVYRFERFEGQSRLQRDDGAVAARLDDDGGVEFSLGAPLPVTLTGTGSVAPDDLQLTVSGIDADLERLATFFGGDTIGVRDGRASGSLRVLGQPDDPDIFGTVTLTGIVVEAPVSSDPVGPLESVIIFEGKQIRLPETRVPVGSATAVLDARALLNRLSVQEYEANIAIADEQGIRVDESFGPVRVDGLARGRIQIAGTGTEMRVVGTVQAAGTSIVIEDTEVTERDVRDDSLIVDLEVQTGRAVQFIWPDQDFPILRSNFATGQTVNLQLDTAQDQFALTGTLDIQSGDVFYFDRNFLIRDGSVVFDEDGEEFDPRLSATAELREVTPDGPVRIYLVADGQPLSEFSPRFESNPPLAGADIVAILGGNIFQQEGAESVDLTTALLSTSDVVTQFGVFRQFEDAVRERLDLDLFAIRTSVIQNVLLSAITPTDETQASIAPSLGNYLNNTSIFMGRYLGESVFAQGVIQLRSRDFDPTGEEDPGIQRLGGVLIDSEISLEWQTPFFLLEWNFAPQTPEELFIRDNTFTFSWSFTY